MTTLIKMSLKSILFGNWEIFNNIQYTQKYFNATQTATELGSGGRAVERRTVQHGDGDSIPSATVSKLRQFRSPHICK